MPTYLIPDGTYKFQNVQYPGYVADLINAVPLGPISGYQESPSNTNDKVRVVPCRGLYSPVQ